MELAKLVSDAVAKEITAFRDALAGACGDRLLCLTLYGSAARGIFRAPESDLNLLVVVDRPDYALLRAVGEALSKSFTTVRATPYLLADAELPRAVDAFPTRFLEMKRGYMVLAGRDVLAGAQIDKAELALRARQELLNILMRFRHQIVGGDSPERLEAALRAQLPGFVKTLRTLVYLRTGEHIDDRDRLVEAGASLFGFSRDAFAQLMAWRRQAVAFQGAEWRQAAQAFLDGLSLVAEKCDV